MAESETPNPAGKTSIKLKAAAKTTPKRPRAAQPAKAGTAAAAAPKAIAAAPPPKGKTDELKSKVKDDMKSFKNKATDSARAAAEKGKDRAAEAVTSISKLIRDSAATIDENVGRQYGDYARTAADSVDGFAGKIESRDVDQIVAEVRDLVRKSPAVAVGAAAAIGFILARLVRSGDDNA